MAVSTLCVENSRHIFVASPTTSYFYKIPETADGVGFSLIVNDAVGYSQRLLSWGEGGGGLATQSLSRGWRSGARWKLEAECVLW